MPVRLKTLVHGTPALVEVTAELVAAEPELAHVAFDKHDVEARFVRDWRRLTSFGGTDIDFLKSFARHVQGATADQLHLDVDGPDAIDLHALRTAAGEWKNTVQFTPPRGSTLPVAALADEVAQRFLKQGVPSTRRGRDRRAAASAATRGLRDGLRAAGSRKPERYLRRNEPLAGQHEDHEFDVALVNGAPKLGVLGMSFELRNASELRREVSANAWTIDDVRRASPSVPLAVIALRPRSRSKIYAHAVDLFTELGADVVEEPEIASWAHDAAQDIYPVLVKR